MGHSDRTQINYQRIWNLAWPIILANITIPLIGATNIAVMGRMPSPVYIGAVALGVVVLQCIYWSFSFLRKGTTGVTAQAYGAQNYPEIYLSLARALLLAFSLGIIVIIFQELISWLAFNVFLNGSEEVEALAKEYFGIRIWGSVATLGNYVMLGWFYGVQRPKLALVLRIAMNALNIPLAIYMVLGLKWGVAGAAWSALISHHFVFIISIIAAFILAKKELSMTHGQIDWSFLKGVLESSKLTRLFKINIDLFIRTVLLFIAFAWFTSAAASRSDLALAVNTVLLNLFWFVSYALDGFANAAEALIGQAFGAKNIEAFNQTVKKTSQMGLAFAVLFALVYFFFGESLLSLLTNLDSVKIEAMKYMPWLIAIPITGIAAFQFDGIYIGLTHTRVLRDMMMISFALYALAVTLLPQYWGNHGLWLALHLFLIIRGLSLLIPFNSMKAKLFS
ncbi:MAG: MATE family efflux transporter [Cyanobacteria bacterium]|nr:MATE family efflux transporter [Cyanobacteriota bacterium]MDA1020633.1 MATE family efflux transporter [Cyanobacteriota bacterium]